MTLRAGARLGPYEILAPLGAGGMGEVYRARDGRLGREVAIKVLPPEFAGEGERLRRFEQEARAASALNHPNVLAVHDVGSEGGRPYLVTELLAGETLRERLLRAPLPVRRAVELASQLANGLAAAHGRGIVHRDLKPENLFLTADGHLKILDFGLAKLAPEAASQSVMASAPTVASTEPGMLIGTVDYMSPEQVRGEVVDFRSDLFSFGVVLHEMLTGARTFHRSTGADTLHAILHDDAPPLPEPKSASDWLLRRIVERCLAKHPAERYASTRDLAGDIAGLGASWSEMSRAQAGPAAPRRRYAVAVLAGAALAALAAGILAGYSLRRAEPAPPVRVRYLTYAGSDGAPAISPDGKSVAFQSSRGGRSRIWLKHLASGGEAPVTEGIDGFPRFFPDGEALLYTHFEGSRGALYRTALLGGQPRRLLDNAQESDVSPDGRWIAYVRRREEGGQSVWSVGLARADGAEVRELLRGTRGEFLLGPRFSPDGRTLAVNRGGQAGARAEFPLIDLDGGPGRSIAALLPNAAVSAVAWEKDGDSFLYTQSNSAAGGVGASDSQLVRHHLRSGATTTLFWNLFASPDVDTAGAGRVILSGSLPRANLRALALTGGSAAGGDRWLTRGLSVDRQPVFSPDGERVVFSSQRSGNLDLYALTLATGASRPLTEDAADDWDPGFSRDGKRLLWSSNRSGTFEIWTAEADGSHPRQVTHDGDAENPTATPDGQWIVYASGVPERAGLWKVRPDGTESTRLASGTMVNPEVSPDGRHVAYRIDFATAYAQVRVLRVEDGSAVPFSILARNVEGRNQAGRSRWLPDGKALAFIAADEQGVQGVFVQDFVPGADTAASRRRLGGFDPEAPAESFGISPDGSRLVVAVSETPSNLLLVDNLPGVESPVRRTP